MSEHARYLWPLSALVPPYKVWMSFCFTPPQRPTRSYPPLDLDKLVRATLDGLVKGGALTDDRHVIELRATKRYWTASGLVVRIDRASAPND